MAAKASWQRYETELRYCHPMYTGTPVWGLYVRMMLSGRNVRPLDLLSAASAPPTNTQRVLSASTGGFRVGSLFAFDLLLEPKLTQASVDINYYTAILR